MTRPQRFLLIAALACVAILAAGGGIIGIWIQRDVNRSSAAARQRFPDERDRIAALIAVMRSEELPLTERNRAIWALGQIADPRALPALEEAHTGKPCNHAIAICQYELDKAIKRCRRTAKSAEPSAAAGGETGRR